MTNSLKLKRLLKSLAVAVAPAASALTLVACKKPAVSPATQLATEITTALEKNGGSVFYVGASVEGVKDAIKNTVKASSAFDSKTYNKDDATVRLMKDGDSVEATGNLVKAKYNFEVAIPLKTASTQGQKAAATPVIVKGSATVTRTEKEKITKDKLDTFNIENINKVLPTAVKVGDDITPQVTKAIMDQVDIQFPGYGVQFVAITNADTNPNNKAADNLKDGHNFKFKLTAAAADSTNIESKEFTVTFTYTINVVIDLSATDVQTKVNDLNDYKSGAAQDQSTMVGVKAVVGSKITEIKDKIKEALLEPEKTNLDNAVLTAGDIYDAATAGSKIENDTDLQAKTEVYVEVKGDGVTVTGSVRVKVKLEA